MANLRSKVNKRKSDSFVIDNSKARKIAPGPEVKKNVQVQLKTLRDAHNALIKENEENIKEIDNLKIQVALLVHTRQSSKPETHKAKETQTQTDFVMNDTGNVAKFPCTLCNCQCESIDMLNMHMKSEHTNKAKYSCNVCGQSLDTWQKLMKHKQEKHPNDMKICKYFLKGYCSFSEEDCWFRHAQSEEISQTLKEFNCGLCGKKFSDKKDFMKHRKMEHIEKVKECKDNENGWCRFSGKECWFKHGDVAENNVKENGENQSPEIITRLFDLMEVFSNRLAKLEMQI